MLISMECTHAALLNDLYDQEFKWQCQFDGAASWYCSLCTSISASADRCCNEEKRTYLAKDEDSDAKQDSLPLGKEKADRNFHADGHEEKAHEQALVGRNVALNLKGKLGFSQQQTRLHIICT